jgi:hypothetical protein
MSTHFKKYSIEGKIITKENSELIFPFAEPSQAEASLSPCMDDPTVFSSQMFDPQL